MIQNLLKQVQNGLSKLQTNQVPRIPKQLPKLSSTPSTTATATTNNEAEIIGPNQPDLSPRINAKQLVVFNSFNKVKQPATACGKQIYVTNTKVNEHVQLAKAYICGPTVYDESHIGHAMTYLRFDLIRRVLKRYCSVDLVSIMNITDIDDKIIKKAYDERKSCAEVSSYYLSSFFKDLHSLNILPLNAYVPVTSQMDSIIDYIQLLEETGYAYVNEKTGDIDLDTSKVDKELSNFKTDSDLPGRRSQADFTLWKAHKPNEPFWEYRSKVTNAIIKGRPGWHVECSVISNSVLGNEIDFHFGGHDLLFPHHVNESRCCKAFNCALYSGHRLSDSPIHKWSNGWIHFGALKINEEKMSKSLDNFVQIKKFLRKHPKNTLRLLAIIHPYRRDISFDEGNLKIAKDIDTKLVNFYQVINNQKNELIGGSKLKFKETDDLTHLIDMFVQHNLNGIADDFDLNRGWSHLIELIGAVNRSKHLWTIYDLVKVETIVGDYLSSLGLLYHGDPLSRNRNPNDQLVIKKLLDYGKEIRRLALEEQVTCGSRSANIESILTLTDRIRNSLASNHVVVQDEKFKSSK